MLQPPVKPISPSTTTSATLPSANNFTVSLWFKASSTQKGALFSEQNQSIGSTPSSWDPMLYVDSNCKLEGGIYTGSTPGITSSSTVNNSTWHYAVLTVNKTSTTQTLYLDGSQVGTWSGTPEGPFTTVSIGAGYTASWPNPPSSGTSYFDGQIDDVRVSSSATARTANWITTEWNNQNSPSTFYSVGSAETNDTTPPTVSITAPTGGATIQNGQSVTASASDAGSGVQQVEFRYCSGWSCSFASGTTIGSPDTTSPYSVTWSSMPANGTYTIVARATDNSGNTADSSPVTVLVSNGGGGGSVGYDTASSTGGAAVTTLSWSHTVASQTNRMLVVGIQNESSSTSSSCQITSGYPKYNGVAMTKIASRVTTTASTYQCAALYYLAAPATGANTVQVNFDAAVDATAGAVSLYNVKQSAPDASNSSNNDSAATSTSVTTTSANSWVVDVFGSGQALGDLNSGAGQTNRVLQDASGGSTARRHEHEDRRQPGLDDDVLDADGHQPQRPGRRRLRADRRLDPADELARVQRGHEPGDAVRGLDRRARVDVLLQPVGDHNLHHDRHRERLRVRHRRPSSSRDCRRPGSRAPVLPRRPARTRRTPTRSRPRTRPRPQRRPSTCSTTPAT